MTTRRLTATRPLQLAGVTLRLGAGDTAVTALDHVDLLAAPGEVIAIAGPSGSGKSSLLAVAGGLIRPTAGTVTVDGTDLSALSDTRRTALRLNRIGYVFQQANLLPSLTAREQLLLMAHLTHSAGEQTRRHADDLLTAVGMAHRADRRPHQLSGGERQRVGIARALITAPAVLLVDEPTSALDRQRGHDIVKLLAAETRTRGTATIMVTHDPTITGLADRIFYMRDGRLTPASPAGR